jgi:hypothetical protein
MSESKDWQRLSRLYDEMGEAELDQLRSEYGGLTETAQQVLRDELKKRGMAQPEDNTAVKSEGERRAALRDMEERLARPEEEAEIDARVREYTWKVTIREFQTSDEAYLAQRALKAGGIESWVLDPNRDGRMNRGYPLLQVAADESEAAERILSQPVPQEMIDESALAPEPWEQPVCPKCGAEDPLLEGVDPVNQWACEACGAKWEEDA